MPQGKGENKRSAITRAPLGKELWVSSPTSNRGLGYRLRKVPTLMFSSPNIMDNDETALPYTTERRAESKGTHCRSRKVKILVGPWRALAQSWEMREGPLRLLGKVTLREQGSDLSTGTGYIYSTPSPELRTPLPDLAFASPHPPHHLSSKPRLRWWFRW